MTPERWRRINDLFHAVVEGDADTRQRLLDDAATSDPAIAAEVRSLLAAHETGRAPLDVPVWAAAPGLILDPEPSTADAADGSRALEPGAELGPYRVVREIGRGGMGIVYEAEDTRLRRSVAVKALPARYARDPVRRERLTREARAAAALAHPSIATIFALDEIDGALYLVSELVRGKTLRDELRGGALQPALLERTLIELAAGLAAAHAAGIVHRDLKPENIVRCEDGRVKILDFGLARLAEGDAVTEWRLTQTGMAIGTPGYMAPEQLGGQPVDARTDVFAFGVVAWELATGIHPFGSTPAELVARMAEMFHDAPAARPVPSSLSIPGLDAIVKRCLRHEAAARYASGQELLDALGQAVLAAPAAPVAARSRRPGGATWWWQVHQATVAAVVTAMPVACWFVRGWDARIGSRLFLLALALSTVAVTIRLNLLFTARVHPDHLAAHRRRLYPPLVIAEALLGILLLAAGALVAGSHDELAAVLVTLAVATVASLGLIEPATTGAAGLGRAETRDG